MAHLPIRPARSKLLATVAMVAALLLASACGGRRQDGAPSRDRDLITREQLESRPFASAYDAVETLHSNWLRPRGPDSINSPGQIWVYVDGTRLGGVALLRTLPTSGIASIRRISALDATARWGINHTQGVILVSTGGP